MVKKYTALFGCKCGGIRGVFKCDTFDTTIITAKSTEMWDEKSTK
jgi:hypothetical protein